MLLLCYQLGMLKAKTIVLFSRNFYVELLFKEWLLVLCPAIFVLILFMNEA